MTDVGPQTGRRFSQLYIQRGAPTRDSARLRVRLAGFVVDTYGYDTQQRISHTINREQGVRLQYDLREFFRTAELRDVLDAVTTIAKFTLEEGNRLAAVRWLDFARRVFQEENVGYRVDNQGGVHFAIDEEFARNRQAAISALQLPPYRAALAAFEEVHRALDRQPPDGKAAIRDTFEAAEILFKLLFDVPRLGATEIDRHLKPLVRDLYGGNEPAQNAANQFLSGFADWVNAAHHYRHGQGVEEPTPPPVGFAVAMVSAGASYVRLLAELHQQRD